MKHQLLTIVLFATGLSLPAQAPEQFPLSLQQLSLPPFPGNPRPLAIAIGDINGDRVPDMIVAGTPGRVYLQGAQLGSSAFLGHYNFHDITSSQPPFPVTGWGGVVQAAALGDLDADGDLDVVVGMGTSGEAVVVGINNGTGVFSPTSIVTQLRDPRDIKLADVDGDGDLDIVVAFSGVQVQAAGVMLLKNNGLGAFTDATLTSGLSGTSSSANEVALFDDDIDGDLDMFIVGAMRQPPFSAAFTTQCFLLHNNGMGVFTDVSASKLPATLLPATQPFPPCTSVDVGDVNGDGLPDLVLGTNLSAGSILLTNQSTSFSSTFLGTSHPSVPLSNNNMRARFADVNNDCNVDVVISYDTNFETEILINNGGGSFTPDASRIEIGRRQFSCLTMADIDSDGDIDMVQGHENIPPFFTPIAIRINHHRQIDAADAIAIGPTSSLDYELTRMPSYPGPFNGIDATILLIDFDTISPLAQIPIAPHSCGQSANNFFGLAPSAAIIDGQPMLFQVDHVVIGIPTTSPALVGQTLFTQCAWVDALSPTLTATVSGVTRTLFQ